MVGYKIGGEKEFECSKEGPRENIGFAADRSHHQQYEKELATGIID